jgi:trimethylamine--corrinoid protein Co-methyltransferase
MVERLLRGVTISAETLALECIERVGPGGNYVTDEHTVEHMFSEFFYPKLAVREQYDRWVGRGAPTPLMRAHSVVDEILDGHAHRLDPAVIEGLRGRFPRIVDV